MKRVLVTGGSRGLGLALCRSLLEDGWQVITVARRDTPELDQLRREQGRALEFCALDLAGPSAIATLATQARLLDGIDAFVANAAAGTDGLLALTSEAVLRQCVETNLTSVLLLSREVIKGMLGRAGGGSLVFIASVAAQAGFAGLSVYSATKGGLVAFSRSLAREYGERGIRSNCVLPGFLETEMSAALGVKARQQIARRTALKRLGQPEDVVGAVRFLLSDESRYVTGAELVVDGGMLA